MKNIYEEFGRWISILYRQFQVYINSELKEINITSSEYIFLIKLFENGELNQEELSSIYYIDKAATARSIKRLEEKGYIIRYKDKNDKREYRICLTEKAMSVKKRIYDVLNSWDKRICNDINPKKLEEISVILKNMAFRTVEGCHDKKLSFDAEVNHES